MPEEGFRVPQVLKLVGITYRQLDHWARTGLVVPSIRAAGGSGTQRLYSFPDILQLRVIKKLLDTGVSLQKIRGAVKLLRERMNVAPQGATLMSDGRSIFMAESPDEIVDLLKRGQGVFAIALGQVWSDLEASVEKQRGAAARAGGA